jgi:HSP20 family molecular chaperone IbpA
LKKKIELEIEEKSLYLRGKKERFKKLNKRKK